ncbi:galactose mutarotase [Lycorma delicatula]|uniref:galactose mutarotase n=1 Tax=Lycorma delicatula TaxID=130591 RepID=UPI003F515156
MACAITEVCFGVNAEGKPVKQFTLRNNNGFTVKVIDYGATVTSICLPVKNGSTVDVVLGFDNMQGYLSGLNPYFGATVGRVANRTKPTNFTLDGKCVSITQNQGDFQLHGGNKGFDKVMWNTSIEGDCLIMTYNSPDGEEGYPGNLLVKTIFKVTPDNCLYISFSATTDQTTVVNLTNHSYFNLAGHNAGAEELLKHNVKIEADSYTKLSSELVATGEIVPVDGTGYDLRSLVVLGEAMKKIKEDGFDINFCLKPPTNVQKLAAVVCYKPLGTSMEVYTNVPGVQFYTSNAIDSIPGGKCGATYTKHAALCLETNHYPNSANIKSFPSIELRPGEEYKHDVMYKFGF